MTITPKAPREVAIVEAVRTPIGKGRPDGYYGELHPNALLGTAYRAVIERAAIDPTVVQDVVAGCVGQVGEQANNIARNAWLQEGLPIQTPATTVDRQCGSAQQAVHFAAALIAAGVNDIAIGSGVEHMGHVPMGANLVEDRYGDPWPAELRRHHDLIPQGLSAELMAERWEISRREVDEFGLRSQQLAVRATEEGRFEAETVAVQTPSGLVQTDEGLRPGTTLEGLERLKPAFKQDGRVTAGNASQISDGASAVLLMDRQTAEARGLRPRAIVVDQICVGVDPVLMLSGPIPATQQLLARNGMSIGDVDRIEINEAFASVVVAWGRELQPDWDRVNVNGGAIALGHPLGASGARLLTTLLHELERSDTEVGLVTMCTAGGMGTGTLIQRV